MKNVWNILVLCLCCVLAGCSDDDSPIGGTAIQIESADLDFTAEGGEGSITVAGNGVISAVSDKDWCTVSVDGMTIHVTVAESQEITSRTALIVISSGADSREIPVVQAGALATLGDGPTSYVFGYDGGTFEYSFKSNVSYTVEIPEDAKAWISYVEDTDEEAASEGWTRLVFTANANEGETFRGAELSFSTGGKEVSLSVVEIGVNDIAGTWNCSYESGLIGTIVSGPIEIQPTGTSGEFSMSELTVSSMIPGISIPLTWMQNGQLGIVGGTDAYLSIIITAILSGNGLYSDLTCLGTPSYENGNLVYRFGNYVDASTGASIDGFGLYMLGADGRTLDIYYDFAISKQMQ